jgi:hypothetical protein
VSLAVVACREAMAFDGFGKSGTDDVISLHGLVDK